MRLLKSSIARNAFFLSLVQLANYGLPLINFPYLAIVLGAEHLGQVHFASALISFFVTITDWGANLTETARVSINRKQPQILNQIVREFFYARLYLMAFLTLVWFGLTQFVPTLQEEQSLMLLTFLMVPAMGLMPTFYFQGMERMQFFAAINVGAKLLFTLGIFLLITQPEDYLWVNALNGLTTLLFVLSGWLLIFYENGKTFPKPIGIDDFATHLKRGRSLLITNLSQNVNAAATLSILGFVSSRQEVGYFNLAEKLLWPIRQFIGAGFQAIYPRVVLEAEKGLGNFRAFYKKLLPFLAVATTAAAAGMYVFAPYIIEFLNKGPMPQSVTFLQQLAIIPLFLGAAIPAAQLLLAYHRKREYMFALSASAIACIGLNIVLGASLGGQGTVYALLIAELLALSLLWWAVLKPKGSSGI